MTKLFIGVPRGEAPSEAFISSIGRLQKRTLAAEVWLDTRRNLEVCGQKFGKCSVSFVPHSRDGGLDYFVVNTKLDNVLASILSKYARGVFLQVSIAHSEMSLRIMPLVSIEIGYPSLVDCFSALAEFCRVRSVGEDEKELFERGPWSLSSALGQFFSRYLRYYFESAIPYLKIVANANTKERIVFSVSSRFFSTTDGAALLLDELNTGVLSAVAGQQPRVLCGYDDTAECEAFLDACLTVIESISQEEKNQVMQNDMVKWQSVRNVYASHYSTCLELSPATFERMLCNLQRNCPTEAHCALQVLGMAYTLDCTCIPPGILKLLGQKFNFLDVYMEYKRAMESAGGAYKASVAASCSMCASVTSEFLQLEKFRQSMQQLDVSRDPKKIPKKRLAEFCIRRFCRVVTPNFSTADPYGFMSLGDITVLAFLRRSRIDSIDVVIDDASRHARKGTRSDKLTPRKKSKYLKFRKGAKRRRISMPTIPESIEESIPVRVERSEKILKRGKEARIRAHLCFWAFLTVIFSIIITGITVWFTSIPARSTLSWVFFGAAILGLVISFIVISSDLLAGLLGFKKDKAQHPELFLCVKIGSESLFEKVKSYVRFPDDLRFREDGCIFMGHTFIHKGQCAVSVMSRDRLVLSPGFWVVLGLNSSEMKDLNLCKEISGDLCDSVCPISGYDTSTCTLSYSSKFKCREQYTALMLALARVGECKLLEFYINSCAAEMGCTSEGISETEGKADWQLLCLEQAQWGIAEVARSCFIQMNLSKEGEQFLNMLEQVKDKPSPSFETGAKDERTGRVTAEVTTFGFPWDCLDPNVAESAGISPSGVFTRNIGMHFTTLSLIDKCGSMPVSRKHSFKAVGGTKCFEKVLATGLGREGRASHH